MATLPTVKKTAIRFEKMLSELLDSRERKTHTRRPRWHRTKTGKEYKLDTHCLSELLDAVSHFNGVIEQPIDEEE